MARNRKGFTGETTSPPPQKIQLNHEQELAMYDIIQPDSLTVLYGQSGTGKTELAVHAAFKLLKDKSIDRVIISRPAKEVGKSMGFLPGELEDKYFVYLEPIIDFLNKRGNGGDATFESMLKAKTVVPKALQYMRGKNFGPRDLVILDEAQNATEVEIKMLVTRMVEGSRLIITGDLDQTDLAKGTPSGLAKLIEAAKQLEFIKHHELTINQRNPRINDFLRVWNSL